MASKEKYVHIMAMLFGPASAEVLNRLSDDEAEKQCRQKVEVFFGKDKADEIFQGLN